jgi:tetratricopeptide (TPR) repeat protein
MSARAPARGRNLAAIPALCVMLGAAALSTGCQELESRRQIQRGNEHYNEGRYAKAVAEYEPALARTPELPIGHHNAGLAYFKLFEPGDDKPENMARAERAAAHLQVYLESNPGDAKIIALLTQVWLDSGQYEKALAYWEAELAKDPGNRDVLMKLANINRQAGRYDKALEWHYKRASLEGQTEGKVNAYLDIAQLQWSRLNKSDLVDAERVAVADSGIAALQKAEALDPKHPLVQSLLGSMFQHRGLGHGATWARLVETAAQRQHQLRFIELQKAAQQPSAPTSPAAPAAPATPAN